MPRFIRPQFKTTSESTMRRKTAPAQKNKKQKRLSRDKERIVNSPNVDDLVEMETDIAANDENMAPGITNHQKEENRLVVSSDRPRPIVHLN